MADPFLTPESSDDDLDPAAVRYVDASDRLELGARILRVLAYGSAVIWAVVIVCAVSIYWDQYERAPSTGAFATQAMNNQRLPQTILAVASSSWPYLAVAVIAYGAALLVDGRRLDGLLDAIDDEDDDEDGPTPSGPPAAPQHAAPSTPPTPPPS